MITRKDYMADGSKLHQAYYAQAATPGVKQWVLRNIGMADLLASTDPHMNDIQLRRWDMFFHSGEWPAARKVLKETGDVSPNSLGCAVCVAKAAARIIIEENKKVPATSLSPNPE